VTGEKHIVFLSWDELLSMYNFDIPESKNYLDRVRDVFCFCAFTSLRYSDAYNLRREDIYDDALHVTTKKTKDSVTIELNKYSRAILAKYESYHFAEDKALPVISNQRMNDYLKELGKLCGFTKKEKIITCKGSETLTEYIPKYELIGTHTARRTFISNAIMKGIAPDVIMKWTGHSDYDAMKPYIGISDESKKSAMRLFDD
jgi:integrase